MPAGPSATVKSAGMTWKPAIAIAASAPYSSCTRLRTIWRSSSSTASAGAVEIDRDWPAYWKLRGGRRLFDEAITNTKVATVGVPLWTRALFSRTSENQVRLEPLSRIDTEYMFWSCAGSFSMRSRMRLAMVSVVSPMPPAPPKGS